MITRKICMLGSFAVGKTSLVKRYVQGTFSEKYLTTIGVKIDKKIVETASGSICLMLWDISGDDEYQKLPISYLRGCAAYLLVVDGTRKATLTKAREIQEKVEDAMGELPHIMVLNKADLTNEWEIEKEDLAAFHDTALLKTSAKTGQSVEDIFSLLANMLIED